MCLGVCCREKERNRLVPEGNSQEKVSYFLMGELTVRRYGLGVSSEGRTDVVGERANDGVM